MGDGDVCVRQQLGRLPLCGAHGADRRSRERGNLGKQKTSPSQQPIQMSCSYNYGEVKNCLMLSLK